MNAKVNTTMETAGDTLDAAALEAKFPRHFLGGRKVSSGVMQAVALHALQLRRAYREVFVLCDIQGHSIRDTASILGIGPSAVMTRLLRARHQMREVTARLCEQ